MLLQVDVKDLIYNRITADQYLIAQLLVDNETELVKQFVNIYSNEELKILFDRMGRTGLTINNNNPGEMDILKLIVSPSFKNMSAEGDFFDEFLLSFPPSITRPDGTRDYLRTDITRCRSNYRKITKKKYAIHKHILDCLKFEVQIREKEGNLAYMKRLPKWLSTEEWKVYEQRLKDEKANIGRKEETGYGNTLE